MRSRAPADFPIWHLRFGDGLTLARSLLFAILPHFMAPAPQVESKHALAENPPVPVLEIEAGKTERRYWADLWLYRELFYFLAWRDILVRYKQTVIGVTWAVLRPVITMIVFVFVFGKLAKMPSEGMPYPVFVFAAMLPWQFFSSSLTEASNSLITNANLISKIYFPRLIVPTSSVIVGLTDYLISGVILVVLMLWYGIVPSWRLLFLPAFTMVAFLSALGAGLAFAALNVKYRDFRYVLPFVVQVGLYVSPVGYSSTLVPESYRWLYSLNPMVGVIEGFRWAVGGAGSADDIPGLYWPSILACVLVSLVLVFVGVRIFRRMEKQFADVI